MKTTISIIILFLLAGCTTPRPWTTGEKVLLVTSCVAVMADGYTTSQALQNPNIIEKNPIYGEHPSDSKLYGILITSQAVTVIWAHYIPEYRDVLLGVKTVAHGAAALHNGSQ